MDPRYAESSRFGRYCAWTAYAMVLIGLIGLVCIGWPLTRVLLLLFLPATILWFLGLRHDYKKTLRGQLYWERFPELHGREHSDAEPRGSPLPNSSSRTGAATEAGPGDSQDQDLPA